jgi:tripartite-type tricarboxylate transporter receptor subunit TctC
MDMRRRCLGISLLAPTFVAAAIGSVPAQPYPARPLQLVVGYAAAGASGQMARLIAPALSQSLGQTVEVVEVLGQDGNLAADRVAKAPGDGHTLLLTTTGMVTFNQFLHRNLPFNPQNDFAAVSLLAEVSNVLLTAGKGRFASVADVIAAAKAAPGKIGYARVDVASTNTLGMFLLATQAGIEFEMNMKWDTATSSMTAAANGDIDLSMQNLPAALPWIRDGRLKALATTGRKRAPALPDVPTVGETLADYRASAWFGVMVPRSTPRDIVRQLNVHLSRFLAQPETQARLAQLGADSVGGSPDDFEAFIVAERNKWRRVIAAAKIPPN